MYLETAARPQRSPGALALLFVALLAGCASPQLTPARPVADIAPAGWNAPLPHKGDVRDLTRWWASLGDAHLLTLIEAAQKASPSIAQARNRIASSRTERVSAQAALLPHVDSSLSASRGVQSAQLPTPATSVAVGLQASWEADVLRRLAHARTAADERLLGSQAAWHEARVSVAAETATVWFDLRTCAALENIAARDAKSREETARLTRLAADAGFQTPANTDLAEASASQSRMQLAQQHAKCQASLKGLAALTATEEEMLAALLDLDSTSLPAPPAIEAVPARLLAQRPDVYAAEREVVAAAADVRQANAQQLPRVTLTGSVNRGRFYYGGTNEPLRTWSLGPLSVTFPLLDGGVIDANRDAARTRYDEAVTSYEARVRQAVREVEEALINLESTRVREADAKRAAEGFRASLAAADARWRTGLGSLIELEDQRRQALAADIALAQLEQDRASALISLYRAAGGGWSPEDLMTASTTINRDTK